MGEQLNIQPALAYFSDLDQRLERAMEGHPEVSVSTFEISGRRRRIEDALERLSRGEAGPSIELLKDSIMGDLQQIRKGQDTYTFGSDARLAINALGEVGATDESILLRRDLRQSLANIRQQRRQNAA